ncbi:hypothetical protein ARALYDRAFT_470999, partial [Arabidopsis lyrata subsp. lyrata]
MEKTEESVGIRVYATPPQKPSPPLSRSPKPVLLSSLLTLPAGAAAGGGKCGKRRMVAKGVQKTDSLDVRNGSSVNLPFKASDGKIYYGFVTPRGLAVFMKPPSPEFGGGDVIEEAEIQVTDERYKLRVNDFVHAVMSVLVFMAIAFSDRRVTGCLFPGKEKEMDQVMESFPLMVGIVCSALFLLF